MAQSAPAKATTPPMTLAARCEKNPPRFLTTTVCGAEGGVEGAAGAGFADCRAAVSLAAPLAVLLVELVAPDDAALGLAEPVSFFAATAAGNADPWKAAYVEAAAGVGFVVLPAALDDELAAGGTFSPIGVTLISVAFKSSIAYGRFGCAGSFFVSVMELNASVQCLDKPAGELPVALADALAPGQADVPCSLLLAELCRQITYKCKHFLPFRLNSYFGSALRIGWQLRCHSF